MDRITQSTRLSRLQHGVGSGTGVLDFAVDGEDDYYTWDGNEDADWEIEDVASVQNIDEDRFILYPEGEFFVCEIESGGEEQNTGPVHCWCE